jgi:hypothetical protein
MHCVKGFWGLFYWVRYGSSYRIMQNNHPPSCSILLLRCYSWRFLDLKCVILLWNLRQTCSKSQTYSLTQFAIRFKNHFLIILSAREHSIWFTLKDVSRVDLSQPFTFFGLAVVVFYFFIQSNAISITISTSSVGWHKLLLNFCVAFERN